MPRALLDQLQSALVEKDKAIMNLQGELSGLPDSSIGSSSELGSAMQESISSLKDELQVFPPQIQKLFMYVYAFLDLTSDSIESFCKSGAEEGFADGRDETRPR